MDKTNFSRMKKFKIGDKVRLTIEIDVEITDVWNNAIDVDFLDTENTPISIKSTNDLAIFYECIKKFVEIKNE